MAANVVQILINAKNNATSVLNQVASSVAGLGAIAGASAAITARLTQKLEEMTTAALNAPFALAETVEQLERLASRTGASSEKLQVMRKVIEEGGGNAESLTTALTFLNRAIANQEPLLAELGITTRDAFAAMMQLGQAFSQSDDNAKKNAIAFKLLGRGGGELIADLNSLVATFDETDARMRRSGSLITDEMVPAALALDKQMDELADNWSGAWRNMQSLMVGPANAMLSAMNRLFEFSRKLDVQFVEMSTSLDAWAGLAKRPIAAMQGVLSGSSTSNKDPLSGIETGDPKAESPRATRLKELQRILGQTAAEAEKTLKALEAIDDAQKAQQIRDALRSDTDIAARTDTSSDAKLRERARAEFMVDELQKVPELQLDALTKVREQWRAFTDDVLSQASIMNSAIGALHGGLESGFSQVFSGLLQEGQTFKSAFLSIINSLVEAALAELARIAAAKAVVGILGLAFGGPAGGAASGILTSAGRAPESALGSRGAARATIVNINALDYKGVTDAIATPFGTLRTSQARIVEAFG